MAAFHVARSQFEIPARLWLIRMDSQVVSRHNFGKSANADAVWSPDSRRIAFTAFDLMGRGPSDVLVWTLGEQSPRILLSDGKTNKPDDWTPDGKFVLCRRNDETAFLMPVEPGGHPIDVGDSNTPKDEMRISPDGRFVAYNTTQGRPEVFVAGFPGMRGTTQASAAGGVQPIWTRAGKELIYAALDGQLMSVEVRGALGFELSAPRPLFRSSMSFSKWLSQYAVSADGQRFYVFEPAGISPDAWHVVTRWEDASRP
jgi:Tol biopolymer transport system component